MLIEQLALTHKCHSSIGQSLELYEMITDVLRTLVTETLASYSSFYLKEQNSVRFEFISKVGKSKLFDFKEHENNINTFKIIKKDNNFRTIILPLDQGVIFIIYQQVEIPLDFLGILIQGMESKLNISIDACLSVEKLRVKNEKFKYFTKELQRQREELSNSNKFKDIFLANMSHELKNPLNSIMVISSVMSKNKQNKLDEEQVHKLKVINECGNDLLFLINDVLDISKLEAGEMLVEIEKINILDLLYSLKDMFEPLIQKKGLEFVCEFDENIGFMNTDKNKVKQILKNLLGNAVKFVQEGKIRLRLENKNDMIIFTVKDDGIGISKENLTYVFNRFKQAEENTSRKFGGSGLGLAISKELALLLDGKITVNSKVNKGTTFTLKLARNLQVDNIKKYNIKEKNIPTKEASRKNILNKKAKFQNILVVCNEYLSLFTTSINLKKEGAYVKQISNIENALEELECEPFDVLIIKPETINVESKNLLKKAKKAGLKTVVITTSLKKIKDADLIVSNENIEDFLISELKKLENAL